MVAQALICQDLASHCTAGSPQNLTLFSVSQSKIMAFD